MLQIIAHSLIAFSVNYSNSIEWEFGDPFIKDLELTVITTLHWNI